MLLKKFTFSLTQKRRCDKGHGNQSDDNPALRGVCSVDGGRAADFVGSL